eukprot:15430424-Alexandrium_andersonii.AAC.1
MSLAVRFLRWPSLRWSSSLAQILNMSTADSCETRNRSLHAAFLHLGPAPGRMDLLAKFASAKPTC